MDPYKVFTARQVAARFGLNGAEISRDEEDTPVYKEIVKKLKFDPIRRLGRI